jgi:hypothetical protein
MRTTANQLNCAVTIWALIMIASFLLIHNYDGKWSLPVLAWALMGGLAAPFEQRIPCLFLLLGWLALLPVAFRPSAQQGSYFLLASVCPWLALIWLLSVQLGSSAPQQGMWFWLPALIFMVSSLRLAYWFFITNKTE